MSNTPKKRVGRPPKGDATMPQIALRLPQPMLDAIDRMRNDRMDQPDRAAMIRELLAKALGTGKGK
jgi:metal-responsive CopG/Arc/MetJ family transcriptional regulator